jgi:hypothetical protein
MDMADVWRTLRRYPADTPRAGAHLETAGPGIPTTITQGVRSSPRTGNLLPRSGNYHRHFSPSRYCWTCDSWCQPQQPGRQLPGSHDNGWPR